MDQEKDRNIDSLESKKATEEIQNSNTTKVKNSESVNTSNDENNNSSDSGKPAEDFKTDINSNSNGEKKPFIVNISEEDFKKSDYNGVKTEEEEEEDEEDKLSPEDKRRKKKLRVIKGIVYTVCVILVSVLLAVLILLASTDFVGMFRPYKSANVRIPKNSTTSEIADILQKDGIIRSSFVFKTYLKISNKSGLNDGTYTLTSQMSYNEIIKTLKNTKNRSTVTVTIPEGYTAVKMADLLEKKGVCSADDFLKAANSKTIKFDFQSQIPEDKTRLYRLEGYLFPDTYEFYLDSSAETVVKKMLDNFDTRLTKTLRATIKEKGKTVDDVVNLGSVIQAETGGSDQMSRVSSVFYNRMNYGVNGVKMLQSDVTVLYGKNVILKQLGDTADAQKLADSYNTYKVSGLPAGPINNPGLAAIKAAISPSDTNDYFFVTDKKGNYYYARTYYQHKINVAKAMANGEAVGTDTQD